VIQLSSGGLIKCFLIGGPTPLQLALRSDVDGVIAAHNSHTHLYTPGTGTPIQTGAVSSAAPPSVGSSVLRG
jgi:hypothetical protein